MNRFKVTIDAPRTGEDMHLCVRICEFGKLEVTIDGPEESEPETPPSVEPATPSEESAPSNSRASKNRHIRHCSTRGENHPHSKLTEAQVREIRRRYDAGEQGKTLAAEFGIGQGAVSYIGNRISWAWLED